jgi:hypothetical protein
MIGFCIMMMICAVFLVVKEILNAYTDGNIDAAMFGLFLILPTILFLPAFIMLSLY